MLDALLVDLLMCLIQLGLQAHYLVHQSVFLLLELLLEFLALLRIVVSAGFLVLHCPDHLLLSSPAFYQLLLCFGELLLHELHLLLLQSLLF